MSMRVVTSSRLCRRRVSTRRSNSHPTTAPISVPSTKLASTWPPKPTGEKRPVARATSIVWNPTRLTGSLSRLSLCSTDCWRGVSLTTPPSCATDTASVGLMTAPIATAAIIGMAGQIACRATPLSAIVTSTRPTASDIDRLRSLPRASRSMLRASR